MLRVPWEHEEWGQDRGTKGGWKGSQIEDMTDMKAKHFLDKSPKEINMLNCMKSH